MPTSGKTKEVKQHLSNLAIPFLGVYPAETLAQVNKETYIIMFTEALTVILYKRNCASAGE